MMTGRITSEREAILSLSIRNSDGQEVTVQAIVDTGYNGALTLPQAIIDTLALPWHGSRLVTLADGSAVELGIYRAHVLWHDQPRPVQALAADGGPPPHSPVARRAFPCRSYRATAGIIPPIIPPHKRKERR